jgi:hypothetical protein
MRTGNKTREGICLKFTSTILTTANSIPLTRMQKKQVNNLGLAIQSQEYSKSRAKEGMQELCQATARLGGGGGGEGKGRGKGMGISFTIYFPVYS